MGSFVFSQTLKNLPWIKVFCFWLLYCDMFVVTGTLDMFVVTGRLATVVICLLWLADWLLLWCVSSKLSSRPRLSGLNTPHEYQATNINKLLLSSLLFSPCSFSFSQIKLVTISVPLRSFQKASYKFQVLLSVSVRLTSYNFCCISIDQRYCWSYNSRYKPHRVIENKGSVRNTWRTGWLDVGWNSIEIG